MTLDQALAACVPSTRYADRQQAAVTQLCALVAFKRRDGKVQVLDLRDGCWRDPATLQPNLDWRPAVVEQPAPEEPTDG